jgi:hypothetical protein
MKRSKPTKVKPVSHRGTPKLIGIYDQPPFHITFPITFFHKAEKKYCYFQCEHHLKLYISRYGLKPKDFTISETESRINEKEG